MGLLSIGFYSSLDIFFAFTTLCYPISHIFGFSLLSSSYVHSYTYLEGGVTCNITSRHHLLALLAYRRDTVRFHRLDARGQSRPRIRSIISVLRIRTSSFELSFTSRDFTSSSFSSRLRHGSHEDLAVPMFISLTRL